MAEETPGTVLPPVLDESVLAGAEAFDVVVVGFGMAGACAALEAARAGARVLLLARAAVHGGTSSMSGGHFYLGGGTAVQRATGHHDSPDAMFDYLMAVTPAPDAAAYLILDSAHMAEPAMPLCPLIDGWETVEEMEAGLGLPTGSLVATLEAYNANAAAGEDPDFHKHPDWLAPQDQGPWGAFDLTLGTALYAGFTLGGMACDVDGRVLTDAGTMIGGLYAAGACAANIAQDGAGCSSGTQLGEGSYFGRRAGRSAAGSRVEP